VLVLIAWVPVDWIKAERIRSVADTAAAQSSTDIGINDGAMYTMDG